MSFILSLTKISIFLPLIGAIITGLGKNRLTNSTVSIMSVLFMLITFSCSLTSFILFWLNSPQPITYDLYTWAASPELGMSLGIYLDSLSILMGVVVTSVSLMVHIYTIAYMDGDEGYNRFFSHILFFTSAMLILVFANNFLQLFIGWEFVGLASYLLIGFWFYKPSAAKANYKAFLVNRISDAGLLIGVAAIFWIFGSLDYNRVLSILPIVKNNLPAFDFYYFQVDAITFIAFMLFIGAMGKSAQIPLHVWLPDSMEGPTPISALIHAATMVTAGVFLVARLYPLYQNTLEVSNFILMIGSLTAFFLGLVGIVQNDIKRVIAYSTISQLGYMMAAMGVQAYDMGIMHLMTHAYFKALLFLGAGSVILSMHHIQDINKMTGLRRKMPVTFITMLIGNLALCGIPFFSGYYTKEGILLSVEASGSPYAETAYNLLLITVFITSFYSFRLFFKIFCGEPNDHVKAIEHKESKFVAVPLIILAVMSIGPGYFVAKGEWVSFALHGFGALPVWLAVAGIALAYVLYVLLPNLVPKITKVFYIFYKLLLDKYFLDWFYENVICKLYLKLSNFCFRFFDRTLIDKSIVLGIPKLVYRTDAIIGLTQRSGYLYHYVFSFVIGFLFIATLILWS